MLYELGRGGQVIYMFVCVRERERQRKTGEERGQITDANNSSDFDSVEYTKILVDLLEKNSCQLT